MYHVKIRNHDIYVSNRFNFERIEKALSQYLVEGSIYQPFLKSFLKTKTMIFYKNPQLISMIRRISTVLPEKRSKTREALVKYNQCVLQRESLLRRYWWEKKCGRVVHYLHIYCINLGFFGSLVVFIPWNGSLEDNKSIKI